MTYSGYRIINANNIVFVVLILIFSVLANNTPNLNNWYWYLGFVLFAFIITGAQAFYFEITDRELIIKNYLLPFINIEYKLSNITEIQLLNTTSRQTAKARLKVIRGEKRSMGFSADSLRIQDWQLLVNDLSYKKIPIIIESVSLKDAIGIPEE